MNSLVYEWLEDIKRGESYFGLYRGEISEKKIV